ncbi:MAG: YihY/virulence factor BrkB family protein [Nitrospinae bacterium]|nr:YihY/virulence factor BrkB family protein [Nitrospinota bacterium]
MRKKIQETIKSIEAFFHRNLWDATEKPQSMPKLASLGMAKVFYITWNGLLRNEFLTLASSLAFTTALSLVPILALSFAVAKGFGAQDLLQPIIVSQALTGPAAEVVPKIIEYVNKTDVKPLGSIGLVVLVFSALNVLGKIEQSFNKVWGVTQARTFFRRFSDYLSVLTIGPILLIGAVGLSTTLSSNTITQKLLEIGLFAGFMKIFLLTLPWLCIILALTFLYIFVPNTKVRFLPAMLAGTIAGSGWQITQFGYIHFQVGIAKYNAIYGTFATVPIFLAWVYVSWVIVLVGAEISFACQNYRQFHRLDVDRNLNYTTREKAALSIMLELCKEYERQESRLTANGISEKIRLPLALAREVLDQLIHMGYLLQVEDNQDVTYVPSKPTGQLKIADFLLDFKNFGEGYDLKFEDLETVKAADRMLERHRSSVHSEFKNENFKDLLAGG